MSKFKTMKKIIASLFLIPVFLLVFPFQTVKAEETKAISEPACDIEKSLNNFLSIRDDNKLEKEEKEKEEFSARKNLLGEIISCSIKETTNAKNELQNLKNLDEKSLSAKDFLTSKLDYFLSFLKEKDNEFKASLDDKEKIKSIAEELLNWRQNEYSNNLKNATNFTLSFKQDDIIKTTDARWQKISSSIKSLFSLKNKEVATLLQKTSDGIKEAKDLKEKAYNNLISSIEEQKKKEEEEKTKKEENINKIVTSENKSPSLSEPAKEDFPSLSTSTTSSTLAISKELIKNPGDDLKESLNKIKDVYQNFFKISNTVKKILGF